MSNAVLYIYHQYPIDNLSQTSTQGDDNIIVQNQCTGNRNKNIAKNKMKSSLCRNYSEKGYCPYGVKCQFAHGVQQLRCNIDENSYKTKPCISYTKKCYCMYGFRCNFSHLENGQEEVKDGNGQARGGYRQIIYQGRNNRQSRLLTILQQKYIC